MGLVDKLVAAEAGWRKRYGVVSGVPRLPEELGRQLHRKWSQLAQRALMVLLAKGRLDRVSRLSVAQAIAAMRAAKVGESGWEDRLIRGMRRTAIEVDAVEFMPSETDHMLAAVEETVEELVETVRDIGSGAWKGFRWVATLAAIVAGGVALILVLKR